MSMKIRYGASFGCMDFDDQTVFHASGEGAMADKLSVNSGNNQRGGVFQRLPSPFVVVATDMGANVVEG